jgi:hypothetical protein
MILADRLAVIFDDWHPRAIRLTPLLPVVDIVNHNVGPVASQRQQLLDQLFT